MSSELDRINKMKVKLIVEQPFWGTLMLKLRIIEDNHMFMPTMATNGTNLYFDSKFVAGLSDPELLGVLSHEVSHCGLLHIYRCGKRNKLRWNCAADLSMNYILKQSGFVLPTGTLDDPQYHGLSAEEIYAKLENDPNYRGLDKLEALMNGQTTFEPDDGSDNSKDQMTSVEWQEAVHQATATAKAAGRMPGGLERLLEAAHKSRNNWREILRRWLDENLMPNNYSWVRPSRRYMAEGWYLPGITKENTPRIGVGVDTSGSMSTELLCMIASELQAVMSEAMPEGLDVAYCDTGIRGTDTFNFGEGNIKFTPYPGGGGTAFGPVFEYFHKDPPKLLIYATDMDANDLHQVKDPGYPVLWLAPRNATQRADFGELVIIDVDDE